MPSWPRLRGRHAGGLCPPCARVPASQQGARVALECPGFSTESGGSAGARARAAAAPGPQRARTSHSWRATPTPATVNRSASLADSLGGQLAGARHRVESRHSCTRLPPAATCLPTLSGAGCSGCGCPEPWSQPPATRPSPLSASQEAAGWRMHMQAQSQDCAFWPPLRAFASRSQPPGPKNIVGASRTVAGGRLQFITFENPSSSLTLPWRTRQPRRRSFIALTAVRGSHRSPQPHYCAGAPLPPKALAAPAPAQPRCEGRFGPRGAVPQPPKAG